MTTTADALTIPDALNAQGTCLGVLRSHTGLTPLDTAAIRQALHAPIGSPRTGLSLLDLFQPNRSTCLVVSDQTRETAADRVLPVLFDELRSRGQPTESITVLVASGIHRHPTPTEIQRILGDAAACLPQNCIRFHDPDDPTTLVPVGQTTDGHTVRINRHAAEADHLVALGTATYHYHAGFGGGRKSIVPGIADRQTIAYTHSLTIDPGANRIHPGVEPGRLDGNPVSEAMLACARLCPPDMIINTVLTPDHQLVGLFVGDLDAAHRAACTCVEQVCRIDITQRADLVIASAGAAPTWIQAHKALFNAHRAMRSGGRVVLLATCPEGLGNDRFRYWVKRRDVDKMFAELRLCAEVNGQTALSSRIRGADAILVTNMEPADVQDLGIATAPTLEHAVADILASGLVPEHPTYFVMPDARHVVPFGPASD